jgi:urease accessory protein
LPSPTSAAPAGTGRVELARVAGGTVVVRRFAASPLKLLTPRGSGACAHVVSSTYGGGLLAGDEVSLRVGAGDGTRCAIGTQASTKVYCCPDGRASRQSLEASVGRGGVLAVVPDPVTCFAGARYEQRQQFGMEEDASLLVIDWITSGRSARGERWAFRRYCSRTLIDVGATRVARDALRLDASDAGPSVADRMGRFDCLATVFLLGPAFATTSAAMLDRIARLPVQRRSALIAGASPLHDGAVLRVLGGAAESVGRFVAKHLAPAWGAVGDDPWSRKW